MPGFGVSALRLTQFKGCEYCERDGIYRPFETLCHGVHVCANHIEAAQTDWKRQGD